MLLNILFFILGVLLTSAIFTAILNRRATSSAAAIAVEDTEAWTQGFNDGWKAASNDSYNVRSSFKRLNTPEQE